MRPDRRGVLPPAWDDAVPSWVDPDFDDFFFQENNDDLRKFQTHAND